MTAGIDIDRATLRADAERCLRALAGPEAQLRPDQWTAIEALVAGRRRALVVQRTGWGKSAVYFVATALLRAAGAGPTVIVSPLLALMRNQLAAAARAGITAATINSTNVEEWQEVYGRVERGELDVLLLSPERLNNPQFRDAVLPELAATCGLLVVDEAHCISDWGHDFRPDYRRLRTLLPTLPAGIPVLATTATANSRVVADIAEVLGLGEAAGGDVLVLRGGLDRESLRLAVLALPSTPQRLAWLAEHLGELPRSGIIYTLTVAATQDVAAYLREHGHAVVAYSGQTDPAERLAAEQDLLGNRVKAVVATSALGMGFDKPDLGFVVHFGAPASPIAYYQQVGRAGRAVDDAHVILLPGPEDSAIWDYLANTGFPPQSLVRTALAELGDEPISTAALEARVDLSRSRLEAMLKVLDVDGAARRVGGGWVATGRPWTYDAERYERVARVRNDEQQAMRDYETTTECRMRFLRLQLDDPHAADSSGCGRCDNCGAFELSTAISDSALVAAKDRLARPGVVIEARRMWPTAMPALGVEVRGKIDPAEQARPGRAVARLTDLGLGQRLRGLLAPGAPDEPVPDDVLRSTVAVLADWDWDQRPDSVLHIESRSRPELVTDLAARLARLGRLDDLGAIPHRGPPAGQRSNSAFRLREVWRSYSADDVPAAVDGRTVLLVDDRTDTGWTLTVVARLLRRAGAAAVYPLVLAATG